LPETCHLIFSTTVEDFWQLEEESNMSIRGKYKYNWGGEEKKKKKRKKRLSFPHFMLEKVVKIPLFAFFSL